MFLKLKGGLGATAILGILIALVTWQLFVGLFAGAVIYISTQKPGLSTAVCLSTVSVALLVEKGLSVISIYPLLLFSIMLLKRYQVKRQTETAR